MPNLIQSLRSSVTQEIQPQDDAIQSLVEESDPQLKETEEVLIQEIKGHDEFFKTLEQHREDIVVVKFHAPWCRSCKALGIKYAKWAKNEYLDQPVSFFEIDLFDPVNKPLRQNLGIKLVPMIHMYRGKSGRVEEFTCGPSKFHLFREKLDQQLMFLSEEIPSGL